MPTWILNRIALNLITIWGDLNIVKILSVLSVLKNCVCRCMSSPENDV